MPTHRTEEERARNMLVDAVYRWWLFGEGRLMHENGIVMNRGLCRRAEDACKVIAEIRKREREAKRKEKYDESTDQ